jgi:flagellar protein FliO/FliZ
LINRIRRPEEGGQNAKARSAEAMNPLDWIRALAALVFTVGLLLAIAYLARRYGLMQGQAGFGVKGRLKIIEQIWLDAGRSRAVILRCDDKEHLIVLTPTGVSSLGATHAVMDQNTHFAPATPSQTGPSS